MDDVESSMQGAFAPQTTSPPPLRILLVDDDEDEFALLEATVQRLERDDVVCSWTPDPAVAIARIDAGDAEVVLLDYRLGHADGLQVLRELAATDASCRAILLTQSVQPSVAAEATRLGAHAVYDKGALNLDVVRKIIEEIRETPARTAQPANDVLIDSGDRHVLRDRALGVAGLGAIELRGGRIVDLDARACTLLRASREVLVNAELFDRITPMKRAGSRPENWYLVDPDDPTSAVELLREGDIVAIRDVSADYERALLLESTWQEMEAFAYGASHDLQAPLRKIVMFTEAVARTENLEEHAADCARRAVKSAHHMTGLIDALLEYSRAGNRQRRLTIEPIDLCNVVEEAIKGCAALTQRADAVTGVSVSGVALADGTALRKVLDAVLENAARFVESGDSPRVQVTSERDDDGIHLVVTDDGVGFDMKHAERIFGPFERLWGRSQYAGHGLGLTTARRWLARMGGQIVAVRAAENDGSTFRITLRQEEA